METTIKFNQKRDFGEIYNATFAFIKQEFKPLGKAFLYFVFPLLIVGSILGVLIGIEQQKFMNTMISENMLDPANPFSAMSSTMKYTFMAILVYAFILTSLKCTIYGYIKVYNVKGAGQVSTDDVWVEIKKFFFPVLGTSILVGIIAGIGAIFCIIPGIYLAIALSMVLMSLIFENNGLGDAFSRSFYLVKQNWWITFGIIIVAYIMIYMMVILLSIPAMILGFKTLFTAFKNPETAALNMHFSTSYFILTSITSLIMYTLFSIPFIVVALQYFNLLEIKERPSLEEKIEQIG